MGTTTTKLNNRSIGIDQSSIIENAAKDNITRTTALGEDTTTTVGKRYCDRQR